MAHVVRNVEKQNWICVLYSLTFFVEGIEKYFQDQFTLLHQTFTTQTVHLNRMCTVSCSRKYADLRNWCPTCSGWRTAILNVHRHRSILSRKANINWISIDSSKWPADPREVQKCFEPEWCRTLGSNPNLSDLSVIIGCMNDCNHFPQDVRGIREMRNFVSHNSRLTHKKKTDYCQTLLNFLHDDPTIWHYREAKNAFHNIKLFKDSSLETIVENDLVDEYHLREIEEKLFSRSTFIGRLKDWLSRNKVIITGSFVLIIGLLIAGMFYQKDEECDFGFKLQFKSYLDQHENFIGRQWLFDGIRRKLLSKEGLILIAEPGYGKSAAMAQIIKKNQNLVDFDVVHHLCKSEVITFQQASFFLLNLFQHFFCHYPSYAKIIKDRKIKTPTNQKDLENLCKYEDPLYCLDKIINPLWEMKPPKKKNILILVDALDECGNTNFGKSLLSVLQMRYDKFPKWVKFLFTSRNDSVILSYFSDLSKWHLSKHSKENENDVNEYVRKIHPGYFLEAKHAHLRRNFFLLKLVLQNNDLQKNVPTSLQDAFKKEFNRLFEHCNASTFKKPRSIIEIIVSSFKPLESEDIFKFAQISGKPFDDKYEFETIIQNMLPHILQMTAQGEISLMHSFLKEWLTDPARKGHPCYVNVQNGHTAISRKLMSELMNSGDGEFSFESFNHLLAHLQLANDTESFKQFEILPSYVVDKTMCFECLNRTNCLSTLDITATYFNSYKLFKTLLSVSKSKNVTMAASSAVINNNTESFKAFIEYGHIDVSSLMEMFDLSDLYYDFQFKGYIQKDAFTILHFAISHRNVAAVELIIKYNTSSVIYKTRSGFSVLQLAVFYGNLQILQLFLKHLPMESNILHLAGHVTDSSTHDVFKMLLEHGAADSCISCKTNIFLKGNGQIYFSKYNKYISIDQKKLLKDNGQINNFIDNIVFEIIKNLTCESALHFAVRNGNTTIVEEILNKSTSTLECTDFQGLTPIGGAIIFQQAKSLEHLVQKGGKLNFTCKPNDVTNRIKIMRKLKVYEIGYTMLFNVDEYCPEGATAGHLLSLYPSCDVIRVILNNENINSLFNTTDNSNRSPLYYLICKRTGIFDLTSFKMLLFMIGCHHTNINHSKLLIETGLCNINLEIEINIDRPSTFPSLCASSSYDFPHIRSIFIKVNSSVYKGKKISTLFPIKKPEVLNIMFETQTKDTFPVVSINVIPLTDADILRKLSEKLNLIDKRINLNEKLNLIDELDKWINSLKSKEKRHKVSGFI